MQQQRLQPDVIAYRALISACESGASVTAVFDDMQQQRVQANVITYNSSIQACEKGKDSKDFEQKELKVPEIAILSYLFQKAIKRNIN